MIPFYEGGDVRGRFGFVLSHLNRFAKSESAKLHPTDEDLSVGTPGWGTRQQAGDQRFPP
jgi:hypothetical protein